MIQDYRLVLEICEGGVWKQIGEKSIRTRSLNSAKAISTNFYYEFEETRYFAGKIDTGWTQEIRQNGNGLLYVSRKHHDCWHKVCVQRVEWRDPQLKLYDNRIADQRIHESWINYRLTRHLDNLLEEYAKTTL